MTALVRAVAIVALVVTASQAAPASAKPPGPCANGYVGLTFDDGPTAATGPAAATAGLLKALTANGLRATMFDIATSAQWTSPVSVDRV